MLKTRIRRLQAETGRALDRLADIFAACEATPLREMSEAEMRRRDLRL